MSEKNKWQQYKEKYGTTPFDLLNPNTRSVDIEIKNKIDNSKLINDFIKIIYRKKEEN
jgi:hypothetical protein